jgi:hypothetical protein
MANHKTIGAGAPTARATLSATALVKGCTVEDPTAQMFSRAAGETVKIAIPPATLTARAKNFIQFLIQWEA